MGNVLQNNVAADISAAAHCQDIFEVLGQGNICKLVHHQPHMNRQRTVVFRRGIGQPKKLVEKLRVKHRCDEIKSCVIVGQHNEQRPLLQPHTRQEHFIARSHFCKLAGVEHVQVCRCRNQDGLQRLFRTQHKRLELQDGGVLRVTSLQFSEQHHQGVLDHFIFADLAIQNHIHQCGKILLTGRGFVHEIENQCGDQQHRRIIPKLITAAGGILGFGVVDNGERQLDGVLIGFEIGHRIVMALKMHKVKHCHADTFRFHDSAEGARQFPFGVQK